MSYPYFQCVSCQTYVQKAIPYELGKLPQMIVINRNTRLSTIFDTGHTFAFCRGQGLRYNDADAPDVIDFIEDYHFNFSALFKGYCCFCALHAGFGAGLFVDTACYSCKHKHEAVSLIKQLLRPRPLHLHDGNSSPWATLGWSALPAAVVDKILQHLLKEGVQVEEGCIMVKTPKALYDEEDTDAGSQIYRFLM